MVDRRYEKWGWFWARGNPRAGRTKLAGGTEIHCHVVRSIGRVDARGSGGWPGSRCRKRRESSDSTSRSCG